MRIVRMMLPVLLIASAARGQGMAPPASRSQVTGGSEGLFPYKFETSGLRFEDLLTEKGGTQRLGKVMEWANQVLFYDQSGELRIYDLADVATIQTRRGPRQLRRPKQADLTVAYVERLPRDPSWIGRIRMEDGLPSLTDAAFAKASGPKAGDQVTFHVHVMNAGGAASAATKARVMIDGAVLHTMNLSALDAGAQQSFEVPWTWEDGAKTLRVELDPEGTVGEIAKWNNLFEEPLHGLGVTAMVARVLYDQFRTTRSLVDTYCFEDWFQYQVRTLNGLFAASVYPSSPDGILERVRCDRILVADDPVIATWPQDRAAIAIFGPPEDDQAIVGYANYVDWPRLQGIARELGLVDLRATDTSVTQCMVRDEDGFYIQRKHTFPWPMTTMYRPGGFPFTEVEAHYLNAVRGKPRGFSGEYLFGIPESVLLDVRANDGSPAADVRISGFQLNAEGEYAGSIGAGTADPLFEIVTDSRGRAALPNQPAPDFQTPNGFHLRPNPFGKISPDGANGLLMLRLRQDATEEYHFLRLFDCNLAFARGQTGEYVHALSTRLAPAEGPPSPSFVAVLPRDAKDEEHPALFVQWPFGNGLGMNHVEEFRLYRRFGYEGQESPWILFSTVGPENNQWRPEVDVPYGGDPAGGVPEDMFVVASEVDKDGRESAPAPVQASILSGKDAVSLAITPGHQAHIPISGDPESQIMHYNGAVGTQPFGLRFHRFPGYRPSFAGAAILQDGRLLLADPTNHVLGVYDRGDLVETMPARPAWPGAPSELDGEFNDPADVAVDSTGRIYVADRGNNRVQILDARGSAAGRVDAEFKFEKPEAVAWSNDRLCVTDRAGTRVRVYDVSGASPQFMRELPTLADANRALVSKTDRVYVTGRDPATKAWAVLVYQPEAAGATFKEAITTVEGEIGDVRRPRGFYLWTAAEGQYGYFVNRLPFNVRRVTLE